MKTWCEYLDELGMESGPLPEREDVARTISALKLAHPGIVQEWNRQRNEEGNDWIAPDTKDGLVWWLDSEVSLAEDYKTTTTDVDGVAREQAISDFCGAALEHHLGIGA